MHYAENQGVQIYYEIEGEGPPLLLHHGLADSPKLWRTAGYIKPLAKQYQTIILHVRGHGQSDKPHNPEAYSSESYVSDVIAVMDHQGHDKARARAKDTRSMILSSY
jgi:pimeloyl-ACP methyl ester carboxylesterase